MSNGNDQPLVRTEFSSDICSELWNELKIFIECFDFMIWYTKVSGVAKNHSSETFCCFEFLNKIYKLSLQLITFLIYACATYFQVLESESPSRWLEQTKPLKSPYYPQVGDKVVYFRQGHRLYFDAVKTADMYQVNAVDEPWTNISLDVSVSFVWKIAGLTKFIIYTLRKNCVKITRISIKITILSSNPTIRWQKWDIY